ncbi:MAG: 50S ribosomal protein L23 [Deltaproteobacteria bacterium]|nr:MAG: 50S ribosomal protein L23 [Deltaproteobacteria bacterium]
MKSSDHVLIRPVVTEKTAQLQENLNQYTFAVHPKANKIEIRNAVEKRWNVKVLDVRTMRVRGKNKRVGRNFGRKPTWKRAIVTLRPDDRIEFFEGV